MARALFIFVSMLIANAQATVVLSLGDKVNVTSEPFLLKGVNTITGSMNGFINIAPSLGSVASTFDSFSGTSTSFSLGVSAFELMDSGNITGAYGFTVNTFASTQAESGSTLLQGFSSSASLNLIDLYTTISAPSAPYSIADTSQATFATFYAYTNLTTAEGNLDPRDLVTKNISTMGNRLRWEDANGESLYSKLTTNTVLGVTTTTVSLQDSSGNTHDPLTDGAATLIYDNAGSVIDYLHPNTNSSISSLNSNGTLALVSSNSENTSYIFSPFDSSRVSIFPLLGTSRFVDISGDGDKVAGVSFTEGYGLSLSNPMTIGSSGVSGFILGNDGTYTELPNYQLTQTCTSVTAYDCSIYSLGLAPTALSSDGSLVVGAALMMNKGQLAIGNLDGATYTEGFYWDSANGTRLLGDLSGGNRFSVANAANEDGSVIIGASESSNGMEAFKWTSSGGMTGLGDLAGGEFYSAAMDINNSGSVIVGFSAVGSVNSQPIYEAFKWDSTNGMTGIGRPSTSTSSMALAISGNGNVIVGTQGDLTSRSTEAFRWTTSTGRELVTDWLARTGVSIPSGYTLNTATSTNSDGSIIGGSTNEQSWLALAGRGVIYPDSFTPALLTPATIADQSLALTSLSLEGAHHIPLKTMTLKKDNCYWVNGDKSNNDSDNSQTSIFEIGTCFDLNSTTRLGLGLGESQTSINKKNISKHSLNGKYLYAELGITPIYDDVVFTFSGLAGRSKSTLGRYYANVGTYDLSEGSPDIDSLSFKFRTDWLNAFTLEDFSISPSFSITNHKTVIDAYTETGGGFPSNYDKQIKKITEIKLGLSATKRIDNGSVRILLDRYEEIDRNNSRISGEVLDWMAFDLEDTSAQSDRTRIGFEIDKNLDKDFLLSFLASASSINGDLDKAAAISLKYGF